ncbi:EF-P 5-aminopentanol modification-associated protein YfmH [Virgibacillus pantothenticus]|uniref:Zinc protease n=1 Tax=Virgibacillus pantothenticus TaxID=1473 RepID=A0A0L0QPS6_VIRPA|nr:pitrilysin family protein [Virgibacillus pantothenticus]KNE20233.1 zinc protease [Virgibacillus pantothenticus]MED3735782.1 pitrilysin family protein [Virgibacillus pantothenticus]QTY18018.1 insulinase family protein [Virgibacillus pantothenticus]SIS56025.1 Predicted Zn-dependent peptidase [Virgibacillus pantothenticus]
MNKHTYSDIDETLYTEKLANGLTVFLLPKPEMAKTHALFTTNYGSIDLHFTPIGKDKVVTVPEGVAHFLEHKLFESETGDVFQDFSKQGASANAYTSFTKTAYLFTATDHIEKNVETLIDFVQDPYFTDESVEKEKGIIAQEIKMYDDQPEWQAFMGTIKAMFQEHPINVDIAGTVESIYQITKEDLYTCYRTFYHPENMILFIAGNFDPEQMGHLIKENQSKKQFAKMEKLKRKFPEEPEAVAMKEKQITMPVSIPKCTIGIKRMNHQLPPAELLTQDLLQDMLLDYYFSKGGPYYEELYNENLIDDSFFFEANIDRDFGYVLIGSNTNEPHPFAERLKSMLLRIQQGDLDEETFQRIKKKKIGQLLRMMNRLENIANAYTHYHLLGIDFFTLLPAVRELTLDDAKQFMRSWIDEERLSVCTIAAE